MDTLGSTRTSEATGSYAKTSKNMGFSEANQATGSTEATQAVMLTEKINGYGQAETGHAMVTAVSDALDCAVAVAVTSDCSSRGTRRGGVYAPAPASPRTPRPLGGMPKPLRPPKPLGPLDPLRLPKLLGPLRSPKLLS